ncbi:MFS transporter [Evansella cellulosilytica]|uniref:Major facilitator superfamily MFS_1 n=1 Tax=Evansella cellulosilytica (strain ATCC 21833 / DSM 2522 / FERM P-1141 / JCM 9156 / N-4) TaxID=649639 RepID=E6TWW2_EVAC2|nr:MFS transporter [Evansella cellulosilytica]ADU29912.1 major facilitator superfamily MFS_1 [Evansella cellulosilytica DSM 2522]
MKKLVRKMIGDVEPNKDLNLLLIIGGLYSLGIALSNTFVNVYLWKQSGEFMDLALYNLASVVMQPITFIIAGRWAKKVDRVIVLRLGVSFLSIFYFTVLFLGENAGNYLLLLGGMLGIGLGFYWLSFNVLTFEITEPETRDFFNGFLGILTSFAGMIGPISAGFLITHMDRLIGYRVIFAVSLGLFLTAVVLSLFLNRRSAKGQYQLLDILKVRKNNPHWKRITRAQYFQGLREGSFIFVIVVWIYVATGSELALGTYGLVASSVSFISYYLVGRFIKPQQRKHSILLGGIILYLAIFIIAFDLDFTRLIIYGVTISIAYPMLLVPYVSLTYDVIGTAWKAAEMRVEYIVVRELFINSGRISSILVLMLFIQRFGEEKGIPAALLLLGLGHAVIYWCVRKINLPMTKEKESYSVQKREKH